MSLTASDLHGVLVVDKASGMTSHDVVAIARRALATRQIGHSGTLDPMATGVLILLLGEATKLAAYLGDADKAYDATLSLGVATASLDADGEVTARAPVPALEQADVAKAASTFVGEHPQQVPLVSAVKVAGRALYKAARREQEVEPPTRLVRLESLRAELSEPSSLELSLTCGKGYYVRSLARDLAQALGTVGHLTRLRRTANAGFGLEQAVSVAELQAARSDGEARARLQGRVVGMMELGRRFARVVLDERGILAARQGKLIGRDTIVEARPGALTNVLLAIAADEWPVALLEEVADGYRVKRGFVDRVASSA